MNSHHLRNVFSLEVNENRDVNPFETRCNPYIDRSETDYNALYESLPEDLFQLDDSPIAYIRKWRRLLVLLLVKKEGVTPPFSLWIEHFELLLVQTRWANLQLVNVYKGLVGLLLNIQSKDPIICQFTSGACPLEVDGEWPLGEIPHPIFHAELGLVLCLYGKLAEDTTYITVAEKITEWQIKTLDHEYNPFLGLYSYEGEVVFEELLISNYSLFNTVARLCHHPDLAFLADRQLEHFMKMRSKDPWEIPSFYRILNQWFSSFPLLDSVLYKSSENFIDKDLALVGLRTNNTSTIASLYGGKSGMGCFHHGDVQIVSYGTQHSSLGDCSGFGLEGARRMLAHQIKAIEASNGEFNLIGVARLAGSQKESSLYKISPYKGTDLSGVWMETEISYKNECLSIDTNFLKLFDIDLSFTLFVKASECFIEGKEAIKPRSLKHYKVDAQRVLLKGQTSAIILDVHQKSEMHIIPLGGGNNFWGADFLIAYICDPLQSRNKWTITTMDHSDS